MLIFLQKIVIILEIILQILINLIIHIGNVFYTQLMIIVLQFLKIFLIRLKN